MSFQMVLLRCRLGQERAERFGTMSFQMVLLLYDEAIAAFAELGD